MTQRFSLPLSNALKADPGINDPYLTPSSLQHKEGQQAKMHIKCLTSHGSSLDKLCACTPGTQQAHQDIGCSASIAQWQRRGEREGDSTRFGLSIGKSGRQLVEPLLPIAGTDKPKARVKANPDLKLCSSCSHAPSSCTISRSSTHSKLW